MPSFPTAKSRTATRPHVGFFRRRIVWISGILLLLTGGALWATNIYLRQAEARVWEIGESIRSRFDDFGGDYLKGDPQLIGSYYADSFTGSSFGFDQRQKVSLEGGILLEQWAVPAHTTLNREQFRDQLLAYRAQMRHAEMAKFKMVFLNRYTENSANILMRFQVYGTDAQDHPLEDRGHFNVDLLRQEGEWRIARQELIEATRVVGIDSKYFVDVTHQVGIDFNTGANAIFKQRRYKFAISDRSSGGVAAGDFDGDGYPDLFFAGSEGSKLYRNTGHGTFEDVTARAGLSGEKTTYAKGAVFADYNNDGCLDLFVTRGPNVTNKLFRNNCDGTFTDVTRQAGLELATYSTTAAFADIDNDGYLDLFVAVSGNALERVPTMPSHDRHGEPDHLYRNNGNGTFTDITETAGVGDLGWGIGATFLDYDNDGNPDIYVANDFGRNSLFHNEGHGRFKDVSRAAGALDYGFGMCASPGDYNNDGYLDLYVSNVYSGSTWYLQHSSLQFIWGRIWDPRSGGDFKAAREVFANFGSLQAVLDSGKKFGEGNSLLENQGNGTFKSVGVAKGVNMVGWAWGSDFIDFDNDGDLDIHGVNGFISNKKGTDL